MESFLQYDGCVDEMTPSERRNPYFSGILSAIHKSTPTESYEISRNPYFSGILSAIYNKLQ